MRFLVAGGHVQASRYLVAGGRAHVAVRQAGKGSLRKLAASLAGRTNYDPLEIKHLRFIFVWGLTVRIGSGKVAPHSGNAPTAGLGPPAALKCWPPGEKPIERRDKGPPGNGERGHVSIDRKSVV